MNPDQMQGQTEGEMSPDQAAASLALATKMSEGLMPQAPVEQESVGQNTPQEAPQNAPEQAQPPQPKEDAGKEMEGLKTEFKSEIQKMREELRNEMKTEMNDLKETIKQALADEPTQS